MCVFQKPWPWCGSMRKFGLQNCKDFKFFWFDMFLIAWKLLFLTNQLHFFYLGVTFNYGCNELFFFSVNLWEIGF